AARPVPPRPGRPAGSVPAGRGAAHRTAPRDFRRDPRRQPMDRQFAPDRTGAGPLVIDPAGPDGAGEAVRIASRGPATRVRLPGAVDAWSVGRLDLLKRLLTDSRVSKDARQHWPAFAAGEIPQDWQLFAWVAVTNMFTAYGGDHTRLRKLV